MTRRISWSFVAGGTLLLAGSALHPHEHVKGGTLEDQFHAMFRDSHGYPAHVLLLVGIVNPVLSRRFTDPHGDNPSCLWASDKAHFLQRRDFRTPTLEHGSTLRTSPQAVQTPRSQRGAIQRPRHWSRVS